MARARRRIFCPTRIGSFGHHWWVAIGAVVEISAGCGARTDLASRGRGGTVDGGGSDSSVEEGGPANECSAEPLPVFMPTFSYWLGIDNSSLYYTSPATGFDAGPVGGPSFLWRLSTSAGTLSRLASTGPSDQDAIVTFGQLDSTDVFLREASGRIRRVPLSGAPAVDLAVTAQAGAFSGGLALNSGQVFFGDGNSLMEISRSGGPAVALPTPGPPYDVVNVLAADDADVYFTQGGGTFAYDLKTGAAKALDFGQPAESLVINGATLYATTSGQVRALGSGAAHSAVLATRLYSPVSIAVEKPWVYWLDEGAYPQPPHGGANTRVVKVATTGGQPVVLATGERLSGLAVDQRCAYWISDSTIMRAAR